MDKRIFDFSDEGRLRSIPEGQGALTLLAGIDGFGLLATDNTGAVCALREWVFTDARRTFNHAEMEIRRVLGSEPLLGRSYGQLHAALFNTYATLTPQRLFDPGNLGSYFQLLLHRPTADSMEFGYEPMPEFDCTLVWAVEPLLKRMLTHYFPSLQLKHQAASLLRGLRLLAPTDSPAVFAHIRNELVQVVVFERRNLLYYNTAFYRHPNDLLYFVLLAYDQFRLQPSEVPLVLAGSILAESDYFRQLQRYIRFIRFAPLPVRLPEEARSTPEHLHFELFSLKMYS